MAEIVHSTSDRPTMSSCRLVTKGLVALIASLGFRLSAAAADWIYIGGNFEENFFIDQSSIVKPVTGPARAWFLDEAKSPVKLGNEFYWTSKTLMEADCTERTIRSRLSVYYDRTGQAIVSLPPGVNFVDVVPDSLGEDRFETLCGDTEVKKGVVPFSPAFEFQSVSADCLLQGQQWKNDNSEFQIRATCTGQPIPSIGFFDELWGHAYVDCASRAGGLLDTWLVVRHGQPLYITTYEINSDRLVQTLLSKYCTASPLPDPQNE